MNTYRLLLALAGATLMGVASLLSAPPAAAGDLVPAAADTTDGLLAWAGRAGDVRRVVAEAEAARPAEAPALAAAAFAQARALAADPLSDGDDAVRALLLQAQALYERHHGPVATGSLSEEEMAALRGPALVGLLTGDAGAGYAPGAPLSSEAPALPAA